MGFEQFYRNELEMEEYLIFLKKSVANDFIIENNTNKFFFFFAVQFIRLKLEQKTLS